MANLPRYTRSTDQIPWPWVALCAFAELMLILTAGPRLRGLLSNTILLAIGTILVSLPFGTLLALLITKTNIRGRIWLERILLTLLLVPLVVQAAAWHTALGLDGWANRLTWQSQSTGVSQQWFCGWTAAVWIHGLAAVPWVVLLVGTTLRSIPRELEENALLTMSAGHVLLHVTLTQAFRGAVIAAIWIGLVTIGETTVTDLCQIRTFAEEVYIVANLDGEVAIWHGTATVALALLAILLVTRPLWNLDSILSLDSDWRWQMGTSRSMASIAGWMLTLCLVGIPLASLAWKGGIRITAIDDYYIRSWSLEQLVRQVAASPFLHRHEWIWSIAIGGISALLATLIGTGFAWSLRHREWPRNLAFVLLVIGFVLPGPVVGIWLIHCFNQPANSPLSLLTWCYDNTVLVPVLAHIIRVLPLVTLLLWTRMAALPQELLDSSTCEGARWCRQFVWVVLPQCWRAVLAASGVAFIVSIGELATTILVVPPGVSTLSVRIFGLLHYGAEDRVAALCLAFWLFVFLLTAFIIPLLQLRHGRHGSSRAMR